MPDSKIKQLAGRIASKVKGWSFGGKGIFAGGLRFVASWWHVILLSLLAFVFLYYPVGGLIIHDIDRRTYDVVPPNKQQSATVEMLSFIINREVIEKNWTPNLPFFFPSYFLDNMPNFQLGMMSAVSSTATALSKRVAVSITDTPEDTPLKNAAQLLKYNGRIWMFSPQNSFTPVPSANTQYRKARKQLIRFNQNLNSGAHTFYRNPEDLAFFLKSANKNLKKSVENLENQIREYSSNWIDSKEDDVFYYNQGKIYAYFLIFSALGQDYKDIIVNSNQYQNWTHSLKALENGGTIDPMIVRNGRLDSLTCPNHLSYLAFYALKAITVNKTIIKNLETKPQEKHNDY